MIKKSRVEAFSDGVLAIVATIMVLELALPDGLLWSDFFAQWPVYLAFIISFFQIYISLYSHNKLFAKIKCVGRHVYILNGFWLLFACFVPFTVRFLGENTNSSVAMIVYLSNLFLWAVSFQVLDLTVLHENPGVPKDETTEVVLRVVYYIGLITAGIIALFFPRISLFIILVIVAVSAAVMFGKSSKSSIDEECK